MNFEQQQESLAKIAEFARKLVDGEISKSEISAKGRLSTKSLGINSPINSLLSNPLCHKAFRELKLSVENITLNRRQVEQTYPLLIDAVVKAKLEKKIGKPTELNDLDRQLYKQISSIPEKSTIYRVAGLNYGRSDFLYWEDYELIEAAGNYQSFSDLKREGGELHRHLIGRELRSAVISAHPHFSNGFYVGLNGACYRSIPELIVGNLLCVNEVNYLHEAAYFPVGWKDVTKPLKPDFYFPELYAIFEVEMTKLANRGKMRENYVYRNLQKIEIYKQDLNLKFSFLNSEPFYSSRGFDIIGWVSAVRTSLREIGVLIKSIPSDLSKLLYEDISRKQFFLQSDRQLVIDCLVEELGINGIADLDNKHSSIKNLLCARGDEDEIRMVIKEIGLKRKSIRLTQFHQNRRDNYMSLEEVSVFCKKHKIKYVKDWNFFAVSNKELLRRSGIPSNLRDVYLARGEWISWSHAFTGIRDDVK